MATQKTFTLINGYDRKKNPQTALYRCMTLEEARALKYGERVPFLCTDGKAREAKVNGKVKTWKRDPFRIEIPLKYGLYKTFHTRPQIEITEKHPTVVDFLLVQIQEKEVMATKPETTVTQSKPNFETLIEAIKADRICLLECINKRTGKKIPVICAINWIKETKEYQMIPLAQMFTSDPYELLIPPEREKDAPHET